MLLSIAAVLSLLLLLYICGAGPTLLCMASEESPQRILAMPVVGLCGYIVLAMFLAQLGLSGAAMVPAITAFFGGVAVLGYLRGVRVTQKEVVRAAPVLGLGLLAVVFVGWPVFRLGYENYWGFANPDEAYLIPLVNWVTHHRLGIPPDYIPDPAGYRGITLNVIFGIYYVMPVISQITGIPAELLFNLTMLGLVYLIPGSIYALSEAAGLSRPTSVMAAILISISSLVAYTFYLDSLGAFTVIAVIPMLVALVFRYVRRPDRDGTVPVVIVASGIYFGYLANIGFCGLLIGTILCAAVARRKVPVVRALGLVVSTAVVIFGAFPGFAINLFKFFVTEALGGSRFVFSRPDEIVLSLSLGLTERIFALYWGFRLPGAAAWPFCSMPELTLLGGIILSVFTVWLFWPRVSSLPGEFRLIVGAIILVVIGYVHSRNGYGVFKLAAWAAPFFVVGFAATVIGMVRWLRRHGWGRWSYVPYVLVALYGVPNAAMVLELGRAAAGIEGVRRYSNAPRLSFKEVQGLAEAGRRFGSSKMSVAVADPVAQRWVSAFFRPPHYSFLPPVELAVRDSLPRVVLPDVGRYLLRWNTPDTDIAPPPDCPALWAGGRFAVSAADSCRNLLVFGEGWYRFEESDLSPSLKRLRWLRKRGELLLIHPSEGPQRLGLTIVVGPGNSGSQRTVAILLNGRTLEERRVVGTARILTEPFVASGPVSQVEIVISENAQPLPRRWALWNRWVPEEARELNIAVTAVGLYDSRTADAPPTAFSLTSATPSRAIASGFFSDRWMGSEATVTLAAPAVAGDVQIVGMVPGVAALPFPFSISLQLNGAWVPSCTIDRPGQFKVLCPIPREASAGLRAGQGVEIHIQAPATFTTPNDKRQLSMRIESVELVSQKGMP